MSTFGILTIVGLLAAIVAFAVIITKRAVTGSAVLAALLSVGFLGYTLLTVWREGLTNFWINHTTNLTGVQVWWDLLISVTLAFFFMASRARKVGMNVPLWALATACTASIALLAMAARLFWLERREQEAA